MLRTIGYLLLLPVITAHSMAAQAVQDEAPAALQQWRNWVLHDHPQYTCANQFNSADKACEWSGGLQLRVDDKGGEFHYQVTTLAKDWVTLPGSREHWPQVVTNNDKAITVVDVNGRPRVHLGAGRYQLKGRFEWAKLPRVLDVSPRAGLLQLTLRQQRVAQPNYEKVGRLWLSSEEQTTATAQRDSLSIRAFRLFTDGNPALVETRLDIDVSGQEREISTGPFLLDGFTTQRFSSDLPARIEKNGQLRVQLKPGRWRINLVAHKNSPLAEAHFKPANDAWPKQEIWAFAAQPQLRTVEVSGLPSIDPRQTKLPKDWQQYPTYLAEAEQTLKFLEQHRGNQTAPTNQLNLNKTLWLDFDGKGFTVRDTLSGLLQQGRLTANPEYQLGRAEQDGTPLLISELPEAGASGVEVRSKNLNLSAVSRFEGLSQHPSSGWQAEFEAINQDLYLPPGWSLLHASGADSVDGSWVSRWNLWHIFLFLLLVVAFARSFSWKLGAFAFVTLLLTYHRAGAPLFIWFNFAALYALQPYIKGRFQLWFRIYGAACSILFILILLPFMVQQVRLSLYPQLEYGNAQNYQSHGSFKSASSNKVAKPQAAPPMLAEEMGAVDVTQELQIAEEPEVQEIVVRGMRASVGDDEMDAYQPAPRSRAKGKTLSFGSTSQLSRYDAGQKVQVGPGLPDWSWQKINLRWSGPVTAAEQHRLWLVSPVWNRLAYLLSAFLPLLLLGLVLHKLYRKELPAIIDKTKNGAGMICGLIALAALSQGSDVQAQTFISEELLEQYEERLLTEPECLPNCSAIESLSLSTAGESLTVLMQVHSNLDMAFPIPAGLTRWMPQQININGKPARWLQNRENQLYTRLLPGRHTLEIQGRLDGREQLSLNFLNDLHNVKIKADGWRVSGAPRAGQASQSLQLHRMAQTQAATEKRLLADPVAPLVRIIRSIELGLDWRVSTRINRIAPSRGAIHLTIPLLPGESPGSGKLDDQGAMQVALAENQQSFVWHSTLKPSDKLTLTASDNPAWSETWTLNSSTLWHTEVEGIQAQANSGHSSVWVWLPWPKEQVTIFTQKPKAVEGRHLSVDAVELSQSLGKRAQDTQLNLTLRASQGSRFPLSLPPDAKFKKLMLNGRETPVSQTDNVLLIPVSPGKLEVQVDWLQEQGITMHSVTDTVDLGIPASNIHLRLMLPRDRWLLFVGGPTLGPAILFWGVFAVVLVVAAILGRLKITPLNSLQWVLLSMGVVTINFTLLLLIAGCFIALFVRSRYTKPPQKQAFNLAQLGLILFSIIALGALVVSVPASLLSNPDMMLAGNGSYATSLNWYQDLSDGPLPSAYAISLPILYYRLAMLLWSIWLAFALMRWIPWAWGALNTGGFWYSKTKESKASAEGAENETKEPKQ